MIAVYAAANEAFVRALERADVEDPALYDLGEQQALVDLRARNRLAKHARFPPRTPPAHRVFGVEGNGTSAARTAVTAPLDDAAPPAPALPSTARAGLSHT